MGLRNYTDWDRNQTPNYDVSGGDTEFDGVLINPDENYAGVEIIMDSVDSTMLFYIAGEVTPGNWVRYADTETSYDPFTDGDVCQIRVMDIPLERLRLEVDTVLASTGTIDNINWAIK
jgi:hypothetical protein